MNQFGWFYVFGAKEWEYMPAMDQSRRIPAVDQPLSKAKARGQGPAEARQVAAATSGVIPK